MDIIYSSEGIAIGIILNPGEQCECERVKKEIPINYRTWCNECINE